MPEQATLFKGKILDEPAPYFVNEEEVPQSGKLITRIYQRFWPIIIHLLTSAVYLHPILLRNFL
ncbi:hypothetical protein [Spirosoma foliorum]|uniref:Uncharacterized protein n=1 Tax=Spirosoma foliorum TaxID=2710596 RepID=A0A7G5GRB1_9BACT|nr:hypothetical protein [Spirosoma foliorum]QMW01403.1 hypothetical protein H3H32_26085 [Spirosoma foliorum]